MGAIFSNGDNDTFRPEYGEVSWVKRLNNKLEATGGSVFPVTYAEDGKPPMQITQENTMIFWNMVADELDAIAIMYDQDNGESTWYFREQLPDFDRTCHLIGGWCLQTMTMYPMQNVVDVYEKRFGMGIPDTIPDDFQ